MGLTDKGEDLMRALKDIVKALVFDKGKKSHVYKMFEEAM